jgi:DNA-binding response OmpR family regulator
MSKTILIVDDEPGIVAALQFLIEKCGHKAIVAFDGEQAVELIMQIRPDLILLDIMLPGIDGFEVCELVRLNPEWRNTKIIFLTAKADEEDIARGLVLGADAYITKPFSNTEILERVGELLSTGIEI